MDIEYIREFIFFSRYMNVSEAARRLHLSQPALSNHLAVVEKEMGISLIKHGKNPRLTPAGRTFVEKYSGLIESFDRATDEIRKVDNRERTLNVAECSMSNCTAADFSVLSMRFLYARSNIILSTRTAVDATAYAVLQNQDIDCVTVSVAPFAQDVEVGVVFEPFSAGYPSHLGIWMSREHPLADSAPFSWRDLNGMKFPMCVDALLWSNGVHQILRNHGISYESRINPEPGMGSLLAVEPDEVVMLDEHIISTPYMASFTNHVFIPIDEPDAVCRSYIAYLPERVSETLAELLEFVRAQA
ncbi:MAG: LysR family transcriptional regulator [Eggerthellaceae bacterium]|nr:LysR family transcriptional regulator [Eggerthellaceae bacterium]